MEDAQRLLDQSEAVDLPNGFDPRALLNINNGNAPLLVDQAEYANKTQNSGLNGHSAKKQGKRRDKVAEQTEQHSHRAISANQAEPRAKR